MKKLLTLTILFLFCFSFFASTVPLSGDAHLNADSIKIAKIYEKVNQYFYSNTDSSRILAEKGIALAKAKNFKYEEADGYFYIAISYDTDNKFDSTIFYYNKSLSLFKQINAYKACAAVLNNIGEVFVKYGNQDEAYEAFNESLFYYKKINHNEGIARNYFNIAVVFKTKGNYQASAENLFKALTIFEQSNDTIKSVFTLQELGNIYVQQKNYKKASTYYQKAIIAITDSKSVYKNRIIAGLKNNLAITYRKTGNFDKAIDTYNEALSVHHKINNQAGIANICMNIGEIYNQLKNFDTALYYNTKSLNILKQINEPKVKAYAIYNRGSIFRGMKNYNKALKLLKEALTEAKKINNKELEKNITDELSLTYEAIYDYKNAFIYHKLFKNINDSLFNAETTRKITTIELQYNFDKKQRKLEFAQKQKEILYQEKINRQKLIIKASVLVSSLVILLLFTGFGYYRNRQIAKMRALEINLTRNNQQLLSQHMNPHFIFNCLNSIRNLIIEKKTEDTDKYFVTFANLMRNNLEYSQYPAIPIKEEISALQLYVSLEQLRFKNKFTFSTNIDDNIDTYYCKIPSLLLQPFVENAIIHGVRDKENGSISIDLIQKENEIQCIIDDNGAGRSSDSQNKTKNHKSFGIQLTQQRLELIHRLYGNASKLCIIDKKDDNGLPIGTRIEFGIPVIV